MKPLFAALLMLAAAAAPAQEAYRWVGKDGKVHYADSAPPAADAAQVETRKLNASVIDHGGNVPYEMRQTARDFPVTLYVTADCDPACGAGRDFLRKRGIPYREALIKTQEDAAAYKKATGADSLGMPTLLIGDKALKGFEDAAWGGMLETAGYPPAR